MSPWRDTRARTRNKSPASGSFFHLCSCWWELMSCSSLGPTFFPLYSLLHSFSQHLLTAHPPCKDGEKAAISETWRFRTYNLGVLKFLGKRRFPANSALGATLSPPVSTVQNPPQPFSSLKTPSFSGRLCRETGSLPFPAFPHDEPRVTFLRTHSAPPDTIR